jgi:pyruvate/2-oxoglutarate dehydrogenase complex dihydrolipoamide acyltransferase (E2) component
MTTSILVPKIGMTQENITVVRWMKADEELVKAGEIVVVIETAKVTVDIEAPAAGLIFRLRQVNDKVRVGDILGAVADSRKEFDIFTTALHQEPKSEDSFFFEEEDTEGMRISVEGDKMIPVLEAEQEKLSLVPSLMGAEGDEAIRERVPFIGMRRTIARNLVASLRAAAQLTIVAEADMTELSLFRKELMLDIPDDRLTFVDMLVKLIAFALKEFPVLNSSIVGDEIIYWGHYHIGVAVALDDGLVVPVVRNADQKSLVAVSREIKRLTRKARQNQLNPEDFQGGTFTLTSGGRVEVEFMTPIINPPQSAILGIGKIGPKPTVHHGQVAIRTLTHLCLTHDHRVIDGVPAANFIGRLKDIIEHPVQFRNILK